MEKWGCGTSGWRKEAEDKCGRGWKGGCAFVWVPGKLLEVSLHQLIQAEISAKDATTLKGKVVTVLSRIQQ